MAEKSSREKKDINDEKGWKEIEKADETKGMKEIKDTEDIKETKAMDEKEEPKKVKAMEEVKDSKKADVANRIKSSNPAKSTKGKSHTKKNKEKEEKSKDKSEKATTEEKKNGDKISLERKIGFFILLGSFLTGATLVVVLLFFTPNQPAQQPTIVPTVDEGITISDLEATGKVTVERMEGNPNESLEANLTLISTMLVTDAISYEQERIRVAGLPGMKNRYVVDGGDGYIDIVGFLFPNGAELLYVRLASPMAEGGVNLAMLERVEDMLTRLVLPPSEFFREE